MDVFSKCSNYATDTCPCILAERGKCIVCSMCRGKDFCTCSDTVSFCIHQELISNGGKAKQQHRSMLCKVRLVKEYDDAFRFIRIEVPNAGDFKKLGAYVFVRADESPFFDVPISVLYDGYSSDTIGLIIQMVGIKTESLRSIREGDRIYVRGPYFNGIQGRSAVSHLHNSRAAVICRGIGIIPSLHVISALWQNRNTIDVYVDWGRFSKRVLEDYKAPPEVHVHEVTIGDPNGELTEDFYRIAAQAGNGKFGLIQLGLSDYLLKKAIGAIEQNDPHHRTAISCINNAHICCGEGICGACTKDAGANHTVHLCKEQLVIHDYKMLL